MGHTNEHPSAAAAARILRNSVSPGKLAARIRHRSIELFGVAVLLYPCAVIAANVGNVHGAVHDGQHRPVAAAEVELQSASSAWSRRTHSNSAGEFSFLALPIGDYVLSTTQATFATTVLHLTVVSGAAPSTHVQLSAGAPTETITVSATALSNAETFTPTTLLDRQNIALTPGADRTNSLAMVTDYVPGAYIVHDQLAG